MVWIEALVPFDKGELLSTIHQVGMVEKTVSFCSLIYSISISSPTCSHSNRKVLISLFPLAMHSWHSLLLFLFFAKPW